MNPADTLAYVGLAYIAIGAVHKFSNEKPDYEKIIRFVICSAVAIFIYYFVKDLFVAETNNMFARYIGNNTTGAIPLFMYCLAIMITWSLVWYILYKYIVTPTTEIDKFMLAAGVALYGLSYLADTLYDLKIKIPYYDTNEMLFLFIAFVLMGIAYGLYKERERMQEIFAIPIGATLLAGIYWYAYYHFSGINILENMTSGGHGAGSFLIVMAVFFLYATVWHRSKPWYQRSSYKMLNRLAVLVLLYGLFSSLAFMVGAMNKDEWFATQSENVGKQIVLEKKTEKYLYDEKFDGYTHDSAMKVIKDPTSSVEEAEKALASLKQRRAAIEKEVAQQENSEWTGNTDRMMNWFKSTFVYDIYLWIESKTDNLFSDKGGWQTGTKKQNPVRYFECGTHYIDLVAGETTSYSVVFPDREHEYDYSVTSENGNFKITFADGQSFIEKETKKLPRKTPVKFKLTALDDNQHIKLVVR